MWFEELPNQCPPEDATYPNNEGYYRLINNENDPISSMISQRAEFPSKVFQVDECTVVSVSIFKDKLECEKMVKFPRHKNKKVFFLSLNEQDGCVKKTFKNSHHSWWRSSTFVIDNEE